MSMTDIINYFIFRQTYETDAGRETYVDKGNLRLSDLGIGKFIPLQYPWNPKNSPNMCQQIGLAVDETGAQAVDGSYPHPDCHEFLFTRE